MAPTVISGRGGLNNPGIRNWRCEATNLANASACGFTPDATLGIGIVRANIAIACDTGEYGFVFGVAVAVQQRIDFSEEYYRPYRLRRIKAV